MHAGISCFQSDLLLQSPNAQTVHCGEAMARGRSALVVYKWKEPEEIELDIPLSRSIGRTLKVIAQNAGEAKQTAALISPQDPLCAPKLKFLSLPLISFMLDISKEARILSWSKVIPLKSATTGTIINSYLRVFTVHDMQKFIASGNFRYWTTPHIGIQTWVRNLLLLWNLETPETQRKLKPDRDYDASEDLGEDSGKNQHPNLRVNNFIQKIKLTFYC
ncbi:hypothetical protein ACTXT7_001364 [Hymenolepis weldensis]